MSFCAAQGVVQSFGEPGREQDEIAIGEEALAMLSEDTTDCLALANTAILMRLIEELIDCGAIARPTALLKNAVSDLQGCPERSAGVDDAIGLIRKELMPRLLRPAQIS
jgi:hypothetical protein